jgi:methionyl aminopeptidase
MAVSNTNIPIKSAAEIDLMRESCRVTKLVLDEVGLIIEPGISTQDIDSFVHRRIVEEGGTPSTLNYKGYPKSCCTSVNDVICHGIPNEYERLSRGDIINVDVTTYKSGYHGDSSRMYFVGGEDACSEAARELVWITKRALERGIAEVAPGKKIGDIGAAIQEYIRSTGKGYGIVREYTGHGLGRDFHEPPQVIHVGRRGTGELMKPGMTFTIEPMINEGSYRTILSKIDGWTVRTVDAKLSAQWEHTVLVTESGVEILT